MAINNAQKDKNNNILSDAVRIRNVLHNLDPTKDLHKSLYNHARYLFIKEGESSRSLAYDDATGKTITDSTTLKGKVTIGIGFNMDAANAKLAWDQVFAGDKLDFNLARNGKISLSEDQIRKLFDYSVGIRGKEVKELYKEIFYKLRMNEQLAIEDLYFNSPKLVKKDTSFYKHMHEYYKDGKIDHLKVAVEEVRLHSNPTKNKGIQERRNRQADLLSSFDSLFYSGPFSKLLPDYKDEIIEVKLHNTVLPRGVDNWPKGSDTKHYIWRTQCDEKVRASHFAMEGMIFAYDDPPVSGNPGDKHNCRCFAERLPKNIKVVEEAAVAKKNQWFDLNMQIMHIEMCYIIFRLLHLHYSSR